MLTQYLQQTNQLLSNPQATNALYATSDLTGYINTARGQLAGESECVRRYVTVSAPIGVRVIAFSAVNLSAYPEVSAPFNIRTLWLQIGSGQVWMRPRPFEWMSLYSLNNPVPVTGQPKIWSQFGQGDSGSIFLDPIPDNTYTLQSDVSCVPIPLVNDQTAEAIPYPWTDAVPYFAAYLALLSAQSAARQADADRMMQRYQEFSARARKYSTPSVLPGIYAGQPSQVRQNQLGIQPAQGGAR